VFDLLFFMTFPIFLGTLPVSEGFGIQFYQQKAFKEAYLYVISKIMTRVRERLTKGLNPTYHVVVNNFYVSRFTDYSPKK